MGVFLTYIAGSGFKRLRVFKVPEECHILGSTTHSEITISRVYDNFFFFSTSGYTSIPFSHCSQYPIITDLCARNDIRQQSETNNTNGDLNRCL